MSAAVLVLNRSILTRSGKAYKRYAKHCERLLNASSAMEQHFVEAEKEIKWIGKERKE